MAGCAPRPHYCGRARGRHHTPGRGIVTSNDRTDGIARTRLYRSGVLEKENFPVEDVSDYVGIPGCCVWVDLLRSQARRHGGDRRGTGAARAGGGRRPRPAGSGPKLDRYSSHEFLNMYGVRLDHATGELHMSEVSAFITPDVLVTVRKDDRFDMDAVVDQWDRTTDLAHCGVELPALRAHRPRRRRALRGSPGSRRADRGPRGHALRRPHS